MEPRQDILFPFERIAPGSSIVLYGAGDVGQIFYQQAAAGGYCRVVGWIDARWKDRADLPAPFCRMSDLPSLRYDYLLIALGNAATCAAVEKELVAAGAPPDLILHGHDRIARYALCHPADAAGSDFVNMLAASRGIAVPQADPEAALAGTPLSRPARTYNIALTGTGVHARRMALCLSRRLDNARLYAVASRDRERARAFAAEYGIPRAYGSCREMAADDAVDLVHVCTPPEAHHAQTLTLLEHGRHVLCEKPFAASRAEAEEMISLARRKGLLLAEGMWPRYLPLAKKLAETARSGIIGRAKSLSANLFYPGARGFTENGCYLLALAELVFGKDVREISVSLPVADDGEPDACHVALAWDQATASLGCGNGVSDRAARIYGDKGFLVVENANEYTTVSVYTAGGLDSGTLVARHDMHSGYEYEVRACLDALERGETETPLYTHEDTLFVMGLLDEVRRRIGAFRNRTPRNHRGAPHA